MHNLRLQCTPWLSPGKRLCTALQSSTENGQETVIATGHRGALTTTVMSLRQGLAVQARCCKEFQQQETNLGLCLEVSGKSGVCSWKSDSCDVLTFFLPKIYMAFLSEVQMDCSQLHQAQLAFQRCSPVTELISHCAYTGRGQAYIGYI